ncbi:hypothetical protein EPUS_08679 [Endocarpon pusillum Z07020]|uniref:Tetraspanin Tsp3 n=1 Tax=Endocarpon pusillum (strain Z07020 / HMAS-L-300199) TaxID=1263415 RepID=U1GHF3_ENDPU|nr:uncharacterized protein EPUS_08679 [Endocarpon pusillum Z07020]ERF77112.1 hypothetical protein EPUS_08679 [Endocarpon pusillum Z07020]
MLAILVGVASAVIATGLTILAIYASVLASHFSLPTPALGHILSILLPISALFGTYFPGYLKKHFIARQQPAVLSTLSLLDTVLVTLASTLLQPNLLSCELEHRWRTMFQHHNANAIRGIQDALECCGLRTPLDQPWPFPDHHGAAACKTNFGRERSCEALWRGKEKQVLAIWIVVGALSLATKAMFVLLQRNRPGWFQDESARRREYPQGRVIEHTDEQVSSGRYLDQPSEETPLRSAETDVENEQTR